MKSIAISYASKTGTTAEAAQTLARVLRDRGYAADALPLDARSSLEGFDAHIIGAPINGMRWREDAQAFVEAQAPALRQKPVYYFCTSLAYGIGRPSFRTSIPRLLEAAAGVVPSRGVKAFGGRMDQEPPFILRLVFGIRKGAPRDSLDLDAVAAWGEAIAQDLENPHGSVLA